MNWFIKVHGSGYLVGISCGRVLTVLVLRVGRVLGGRKCSVPVISLDILRGKRKIDP